MKPMLLTRLFRITGVAVALLTMGGGAMQAAPVAAPFGDLDPVTAKRITRGANAAIKTGIVRPAVLGYTDSYVYGANIPFGTDVTYSISIDRNGFDEPVTMYLYWWDRDNGTVRWYNIPNGGFSNSEVDLFGAGGTPIAVQAPNLTDFCLFGQGCALGSANVSTQTGKHAFVIELRDASNGDVVGRDYALYNFVDALVAKGGEITASETWSANNVYFLDTPVFVSGGATVTIQAGTFILGSEANQALFGVRQDGNVIANGTESMPIVFTSEKVRSERGVGDWGGVAINGNAPVNIANPLGEGDTGPYGGNAPNDSSGSLRYVRVEFAGIRFNDQDELNGIAFQGVGAGTTAEYLQTISGADDGIEMFGGTINGKYWYVSNANDDSIDATFGWTGSVMFACMVQTRGDTDHLFEFDSNRDNPDVTPRTAPTITNFAGVSLRANDNPGALVRRGAGGSYVNGVFINPARQGFRIDGSESQAQVGQALTFSDVVIAGAGSVIQYTDGDTVVNASPSVAGISSGNGRLANPTSTIQADILPLNGDNSCAFRGDPWNFDPWVNHDTGP